MMSFSNETILAEYFLILGSTYKSYTSACPDVSNEELQKGIFTDMQSIKQYHSFCTISKLH